MNLLAGRWVPRAPNPIDPIWTHIGFAAADDFHIRANGGEPGDVGGQLENSRNPIHCALSTVIEIDEQGGFSVLERKDSILFIRKSKIGLTWRHWEPPWTRRQFADLLPFFNIPHHPQGIRVFETARDIGEVLPLLQRLLRGADDHGVDLERGRVSIHHASRINGSLYALPDSG